MEALCSVLFVTWFHSFHSIIEGQQLLCLKHSIPSASCREMISVKKPPGNPYFREIMTHSMQTKKECYASNDSIGGTDGFAAAVAQGIHCGATGSIRGKYHAQSAGAMASAPRILVSVS